MDAQLIFYLQSGVIGALILAIFLLRHKLTELRALLTEEKKKRTFPLLAFEVNREKLKSYLKNESYCYAKDIRIDELTIIVDYGFKKELKLRFEPIVLLRPGGQMELEFKVFDNGFDVTTQSPDSLVLQFNDSPFTMHLTYKNLEEEAFESTIVWQMNQYLVKEVKPLEPTAPAQAFVARFF